MPCRSNAKDAFICMSRLLDLKDVFFLSKKPIESRMLRKVAGFYCRRVWISFPRSVLSAIFIVAKSICKYSLSCRLIWVPCDFESRKKPRKKVEPIDFSVAVLARVLVKRFRRFFLMRFEIALWSLCMLYFLMFKQKMFRYG